MSHSLRKWMYLFEYCEKSNIELNNLTTNSVIKYNMKKFEEIISDKF